MSSSFLPQTSSSKTTEGARSQPPFPSLHSHPSEGRFSIISEDRLGRKRTPASDATPLPSFPQISSLPVPNNHHDLLRFSFSPSSSRIRMSFSSSSRASPPRRYAPPAWEEEESYESSRPRATVAPLRSVGISNVGPAASPLEQLGRLAGTARKGNLEVSPHESALVGIEEL